MGQQREHGFDVGQAGTLSEQRLDETASANNGSAAFSPLIGSAAGGRPPVYAVVRFSSAAADHSPPTLARVYGDPVASLVRSCAAAARLLGGRAAGAGLGLAAVKIGAQGGGPGAARAAFASRVRSWCHRTSPCLLRQSPGRLTYHDRRRASIIGRVSARRLVLPSPSAWLFRRVLSPLLGRRLP